MEFTNEDQYLSKCCGYLSVCVWRRTVQAQDGRTLYASSILCWCSICGICEPMVALAAHCSFRLFW